MTAPPSRYPDRPKFFANKFVRLLAKACAANRVGADVCWLLTCVAHTEDAKGYRGAVTYFNGQLLPILGIKSEDTLDRVRKKAVAAGWLHYEPGRRSVPGKYWVVVPAEYRDLDDGPTDEHQGDYEAGCTRTGAGTTADTEALSPAPVRVLGEVVPAPVRQEPRADRGQCAEPSTLSFPDPKDTQPSAPASAPSTTEPSANRPGTVRPKPAQTTGHAKAVKGFCDAWKARYDEDYPFASVKDGAARKAMLAHLQGDVQKFLAVAGRYLADPDPFYTGHTLAKLNQGLARWLAPPHRATGTAAQTVYGFDHGGEQ